jgi:predicted peptidase
LWLALERGFTRNCPSILSYDYHRMNRSLLAHLSLALALSSSVGIAQNNDTELRQQRHSFETTVTRRASLGYLLHLPKDYAPAGAKRWPLMLFLHGAGERGDDLAKVAVHGPPKLVQQGRDFPFILVSPQCPTGQRWDADVLNALLDAVIAKHMVDTNRVYLTGLSMGGYGSWSLAARYPERFAAVAPICGGGERIDILLGSRDKTKGAALRSLPVWAFHGAKDPVVPLGESERMVDAFQRTGNPHVKLTVYPEAQHDSWTESYANEALYEWFLSQRRE